MTVTAIGLRIDNPVKMMLSGKIIFPHKKREALQPLFLNYSFNILITLVSSFVQMRM